MRQASFLFRQRRHLSAVFSDEFVFLSSFLLPACHTLKKSLWNGACESNAHQHASGGPARRRKPFLIEIPLILYAVSVLFSKLSLSIPFLLVPSTVVPIPTMRTPCAERRSLPPSAPRESPCGQPRSDTQR